MANKITLTQRELRAVAKACRPAAKGEFVPFAHLADPKFNPNDPKHLAMIAWINTCAKADEIVRAAAAKESAVATAAEILRSAKIARGEIVELPTGEAARAIIAAGKQRRGET
jgi:hypothetical protein